MYLHEQKWYYQAPFPPANKTNNKIKQCEAEMHWNLIILLQLVFIAF